jgi:hypothetical protein
MPEEKLKVVFADQIDTPPVRLKNYSEEEWWSLAANNQPSMTTYWLQPYWEQFREMEPQLVEAKPKVDEEAAAS